MTIRCPHFGREGQLPTRFSTAPKSVRCPSCKQKFSPNTQSTSVGADSDGNEPDPDVPYSLDDDPAIQNLNHGAPNQSISQPDRAFPQLNTRRFQREPRIYRRVETWSRGLILCTILGAISGICYLTADLIFAHGRLLKVREEFKKFPAAMIGELNLTENLFSIHKTLFVAELGAIGASQLVTLIFCGCALILVDIGRMTRRGPA